MSNIEKTLESIRKSYGDDSVMVLGDGHGLDVKRTSSGSLKLDEILG